MSRHCAVANCSNGDYLLFKWRQGNCLDHDGVKNGNPPCDCTPPFKLINFPTEKKDPETRKLWIKLINRQANKNSNAMWQPSSQSRVCSKHFVDSQPTKDNPCPTLNLGYKKADERVTLLIGKKRRRLNYNRCPKLPKQSATVSNAPESEPVEIELSLQPELNEPMEIELLNRPDHRVVALTHLLALLIAYSAFSVVVGNFWLASFCVIKKLFDERDTRINYNNYKVVIKDLTRKNRRLQVTIKILQSKISSCTCKLPLYQQLLKTDEDVRFYSGFPSLAVFHKIQSEVAKSVIRKWKGVSNTIASLKRKYRRSPKKIGPKSKLTSKDEFLLVMMKIRLNLLEKDLGRRFGISTTLSSNIFATYTRALANTLRPLVYIPDMGIINAVKPKRFKMLTKLHSIADATECFIQTPKAHDLQRMTWSNYKHHNTVKFLIVIAPNSHIMFVSDAYAGSVSDKALTEESKYLDKMEEYTEIMVDKGFNITNECSSRRVYLRIPPGKCGKSQMLPSELVRTREIAKLRILVEQVIRRFKNFRILSQEIPVNLLSHIDDLSVICGALCNLQTPIYK